MFTAEELAAYPVLSAEQEYTLAIRARAGDDEARKTIIASNIRLVLSIVQTYQGVEASFDDLVQEGCLALIHATEHFDPERGKFSTYAMFWIRQFVRKACIASQFCVHLPTRVQLNVTPVRRSLAVSLKERGVLEPEAIAREVGCSVQTVEAIVRWLTPPQSLDRPLRHERDAATFLELVPDPAQMSAFDTILEDCDRKMEVERLLSTLPARERTILEMHYGLGAYAGEMHTTKSVGDALQITPQRVRQLEQQAFNRLAGKRESETSHQEKAGVI